MFVAALDRPWFERCVGSWADSSGRGEGMLRVVLAYPCSPYLLQGSLGEWLLFAALWAPIPFIVLNFFWMKRHKAYWDQVRQLEKERRAEKRGQKLD